MTSYAMTIRALSVLALTVVVSSCGDDRSAAMSAVTMPSPAGPESGEPFLSATADGVLMSWLQKVGDVHELRFAELRDGEWGDVGVIATSDRFFVNWADFPSVRTGPDGTLYSHWLQRGDAGGYDYAVRVARSHDGGATWTEGVTLHDDDSPTEHGFVSAVTHPDGLGYFWLDGRNFVDAADGTPATREMTLRYRTLDAEGNAGPEMLVDGKVCDCCQTAAAMTSSGPIVAYRDRTDAEIRDIYTTRLEGDAWSEGTPVHDDGWHIAGCPVNGPAIAADGDRVAVAWFTGAEGTARVKVAFSEDGGVTFGAPVIVDDGDPAGRVDLVLRDSGAIVSWLERSVVAAAGGEDATSTAEVRLRRVGTDGSTGTSFVVTASSAERASGFPRVVEMHDGSMLLAWTDVTDNGSTVQVARLDWDGEDR